MVQGDCERKTSPDQKRTEGFLSLQNDKKGKEISKPITVWWSQRYSYVD